MIVNMIDMLNKAKEYNYAVAQFNINNLEWTKYILEETNRLNVPVILGVSEGAAKYMCGYKTIVNMVKNLIQYLNVSVPVALHLDHGSSFEVCKEAIDAGFTSVMIDASKYELEKNIKITKQVVNYAKKFNVSVEAEVGHVGSNNNGNIEDIMYADVTECDIFCKETQIDFLAPALGSVHGPYVGKPKLNFERMKEISSICNIPLVLHGGSGINDELIKKSIQCGICKININTELQQAWAAGVRENIKKNEEIYDPRKIIKFGESNFKKVIEEKITLFQTKL